MPINPNIPLSLTPFQLPDLLGNEIRAQQIMDAAQQRRLQELHGQLYAAQAERAARQARQAEAADASQSEALAALVSKNPQLAELVRLNPKAVVEHLTKQSFPDRKFETIYTPEGERKAWVAQGQAPEFVGDAKRANLPSGWRYGPGGMPERIPGMAEAELQETINKERALLPFSLQKAAAGRAQVTVGAPLLEKEEAKEKGKHNVKMYGDISTSANTARTMNANLDTVSRTLDQGFETGFGTEAKAAAANALAALGVKDAAKYATDAQTFNAAATEIVLQRQLLQKGPQTESDARRMQEAGVQLKNTPQANRFIIDVAKAQNNRAIKQQKYFDEYWRKNGTYEGAEEAWYSGDGGASIFSEPELAKYERRKSTVGAPPPGAVRLKR